MISLRDTLKLNNQAAALFHSENFPQAEIAYNESLCFFKIILEESHYQDVGMASTASLPQHECLHSMSAHKSRCKISSHHGGSFVYQSPLILNELPSSSLHPTSRSTSVQAMIIYCAAVVFNTAILHHQESIKTGSSVCLDRAAELYEASIRLVGKFPTTVASSNKTISLIAMAASNNLAQIEFQKGLLDQACKRLQVLKHLMTQSLRHVVPYIFTIDEFEGMLSNTLSAKGVIASPAA
ncbi:unnamed protein product [Cylindrotheca closterium]|uniref:Uncharacterized protein n=1 Tax=Cylindrotheca closterium TaxID=2856 RepID=A0AAD2JGU8_9STRA|nr:unnamed protein product [Cylindrotheca closterium]